MLIVSLIAVIIVLALFALFGIKNKQGQQIVQQKKGIATMKHLNTLVVNIQQHRGLNAAWLNGDTTVATNMNNLKAEVKRSILNADYELTGGPNWTGFKEHWERFVSGHTEISTENSFKQHTAMVTALLNIIEDLAERYYLTSRHFPAFDNIDLLWRELPLVTESVGQSRAVGTSVVTLKQCNSVERIRLQYLRQHILEVADDVLTKLKSQDSEANTLIEKSLQHTRHLAQSITDDILECSHITLSRGDYFALATETISGLNQVFDYYLSKIADDVNNMRGGMN